MSRSFLIRHGAPTAAWAEAAGDPGLSDGGLAQAQHAALALRAAVFSHFNGVNVITGGALRRDDTIVCIPGHAPITKLDVRDGGRRLVSLGAEMAADDVR
jgi:broad specificity phosphatase PhoE